MRVVRSERIMKLQHIAPLILAAFISQVQAQSPDEPENPKEQIIVKVVSDPKTLASGEKTTIVVTVHAADGSLLPGATVTVTAGGGKFLPKADTPVSPKDKLKGPYFATGKTAENGQFTTWWVRDPAYRRSYGIVVVAEKEGYSSGREIINIRAKQ